MEDKEQPLLYDPRRAIDHAQGIPGLAPLRLFAVLYPLWLVETRATQERKRPYEFIEHYLERGIGEGELYTTAELAAFFGLSTALVEKALAFLQTIQHVTYINGIWNLTPRGIRSLEEGEKRVPQTKTQKFYFDGFCGKPLLREHYSKSLHIVSGTDADEVTRLPRGGYQFRRLYTRHLWNPASISKLEKLPNKEEYNLPPESHDLQAVGVMTVYLPMYIIETRRRSSQSPESSASYYLAYTHVRGRRDAFFERFVNDTPDIKKVLHAEEEVAVGDRWSKWLISQGLAAVRPEQTLSGLWRVVLTPAMLRSANTRLSASDMGKYQLERRGYFLQIWCEDIDLRRQAVLDQALKYIQIGHRTITRERALEILKLRAEQLNTREFSLKELYDRAVEREMDNGLLELIKAFQEGKD